MSKNVLFKVSSLSSKDYCKMLDKQGNSCSVCKIILDIKKSQDFFVDHDLNTGKVRGILCQKCASLLEKYGDKIDDITKIMLYVSKDRIIKSWDYYFLKIAQFVSVRSKDLSSQVGAVIVKNKSIVSAGYNGFPRNVSDHVLERYDRPAKYQWTIHAEENAIFNASRIGTSTEGATLYVTPMHPCIDCAKAIVQSGIKEVVYEEIYTNPRWIKNFEESSELLKSSKILVRGPE